MFFNLTWRNAKRSRSENLIYFLTMITAVAMFYIVLSLGQQDVIRFLSEIESDAVERLLTNLLPTVYLCALLFVFFLVVFANKYQLECRSRELGLYLMFGMTKIKLFIQIMTEGLITSFLALLGGLVCGGFLSEAISLAALAILIPSVVEKAAIYLFGAYLYNLRPINVVGVMEAIKSNAPYTNFIKNQSAQNLINLSYFNWTYILCSIAISVLVILLLHKTKQKSNKG